MEVCSPWTGRRGVSLPFTDFCFSLGDAGARREPAAVAPGNLDIHSAAVALGRSRDWRYLECRGHHATWNGSTPSIEFLAHTLDLAPGAEKLFSQCEPSVRRAIRKAEKALRLQIGNGEEAMRGFFRLHCRTRRKHGVPPQPFRFFHNIARHVLAKGHGFVATASFENRPVAASVFFHAGDEAIYKFGASDESYQPLRPNNLVMWEAIKHCVALGCSRLHFGRTSADNEGLRRFKRGFGAREEPLSYARFDLRQNQFVTTVDRAEGAATHLFRLLPPPLFRLAGQLLYPHLS